MIRLTDIRDADSLSHMFGQDDTRREPALAPSARCPVVGSFLLSPRLDTRAGQVPPDRPRVTATPRRRPTPLAAGWGDSTP